MGPQHELSSSASYQPAAGPPGSGQPFTYAVDSPDLAQPPSAAASYYTKYSSVKQRSEQQPRGSAARPLCCSFPAPAGPLSHSAEPTQAGRGANVRV